MRESAVGCAIALFVQYFNHKHGSPQRLLEHTRQQLNDAANPNFQRPDHVLPKALRCGGEAWSGLFFDVREARAGSGQAVNQQKQVIILTTFSELHFQFFGHVKSDVAARSAVRTGAVHYRWLIDEFDGYPFRTFVMHDDSRVLVAQSEPDFLAGLLAKLVDGDYDRLLHDESYVQQWRVLRTRMQAVSATAAANRAWDALPEEERNAAHSAAMMSSADRIFRKALQGDDGWVPEDDAEYLEKELTFSTLSLREGRKVAEQHWDRGMDGVTAYRVSHRKQKPLSKKRRQRDARNNGGQR